MVLSFFAYLEGELERAGFFRPASKQPVMRRNLRNMFHRMQLTEQDVRTLRGMVVRLVEGPRGAAPLDKMPPPGEGTRLGKSIGPLQIHDQKSFDNSS
jgi:tRNA/rRNA methyltransferase